MALLSIILPTYNGEKYISKAIQSCLQQSHGELELIIVNDCSTDNTASIVQEFQKKDSRIRLITNPSNLKLPGSLNAGFANAQGDYFTWTSDDNYFAPDALDKMVSGLEQDPAVDIIYSSYRFIDEKDNVLDLFGGEPENLLFKCITGACFLYRRQVHERLNGYAEDKFKMEDMDFWLRAAVEGFRYKFIDCKELYYYRKHTGSLTYDIYSDPVAYKQYRLQYTNSYENFFNKIIAGLSERELEIHIELFFEDIVKKKEREFSLSERLLEYVEYLDKLAKLDWSGIHFRKDVVENVVADKRKKILALVVNDLVLENKILSKQNPKLAAHVNKEISWYYKEYEVLPLWYKRFGHIIKMLQGNRLSKTLFTKKTSR